MTFRGLTSVGARFRSAAIRSGLGAQKKPRRGVRGGLAINEAVGTRTQDLRIKSPLLYQLSYGLNVNFANLTDIKYARNSQGLGANLRLNCSHAVANEIEHGGFGDCAAKDLFSYQR